MRVSTMSLHDSILQVFSDDHARLHALLDLAIGACRRDAPRDARRAFYGYEDNLRRHIRIEDERLLMTFGARSGRLAASPTVAMRRAHREMERRLDDIGSALDGVPELPRIERQLLGLQALVAEHARREERLLFPTCDRLFNDHERRACVHALAVPG
jgi:hypothetical protein